jgi:hypothetical protein
LAAQTAAKASAAAATAARLQGQGRLLLPSAASSGQGKLSSRLLCWQHCRRMRSATLASSPAANSPSLLLLGKDQSANSPPLLLLLLMGPKWWGKVPMLGVVQIGPGLVHVLGQML